MLDPLLYLIFPFLQILDLLQQNVRQIINVACLSRLPDFEQFIVGQSEGRELRPELLGPDSQLLVERL